VEEYGKQLAGAVAQALEGKIEAIHAPLRTAFQLVDVAFAPHSREQFEEETKNKDVFRRSPRATDAGEIRRPPTGQQNRLPRAGHPLQ
jgi:hypothetical protein